MALGIIGAYGGLNKKDLPDCLFVGELSLDGGVRGVRGTLPIAIDARGKKIPRLTVPELNAREAAMVGGFEIYPVKSLLDVIRQRAEQPFDARNSSGREWVSQTDPLPDVGLTDNRPTGHFAFTPRRRH